MKKCIWMAVLAGLFVAGVALAQGQEGQKPGDEQKFRDQMRDFELRQKQLDIAQREMEMKFQEKMREIEIDKRWTEEQRQKEQGAMQAQNPPPPVPPWMAGVNHPPMGPGPGRFHGRRAACAGLFLMVIGLVNLLLAIWTFQDIRRRNAGSGIWIVLALLIGPVSTLLYAVVRIGDRPSA